MNLPSFNQTYAPNVPDLLRIVSPLLPIPLPESLAPISVPTSSLFSTHSQHDVPADSLPQHPSTYAHETKLYLTQSVLPSNLPLPLILTSTKEATTTPIWQVAILQELRALEENGTSYLVPNLGNRKIIGRKWVF